MAPVEVDGQIAVADGINLRNDLDLHDQAVEKKFINIVSLRVRKFKLFHLVKRNTRLV